MSSSKFRHILQSKSAKIIFSYTVALGGAYMIVYTYQDVRYEKQRLKKLTQEQAANILKKHDMKEEKENLAKNRAWMQDKIEDKYEFIPISKPDQSRPSLPKDQAATIKKISMENRLTMAFTKCFSLQSETEKLMSLLSRRLAEGQSGAMKYKTLKEFEPMFTDTLIAAKVVSAEVDDIMTVNSDEHSTEMIKDLKSDVGKLIDKLDKTLSDIERSQKDLSRGSVKK